MFTVPKSYALKLRRSAMLTEHFAPTGLGRCGLAMAINIALLTEFAGACSNRSFLIQRQCPMPHRAAQATATVTVVPINVYHGQAI